MAFGKQTREFATAAALRRPGVRPSSAAAEDSYPVSSLCGTRHNQEGPSTFLDKGTKQDAEYAVLYRCSCSTNQPARMWRSASLNSRIYQTQIENQIRCDRLETVHHGHYGRCSDHSRMTT